MDVVSTPSSVLAPASVKAHTSDGGHCGLPGPRGAGTSPGSATTLAALSLPQTCSGSGIVRLAPASALVHRLSRVKETRSGDPGGRLQATWQAGGPRCRGEESRAHASSPPMPRQGG